MPRWRTLSALVAACRGHGLRVVHSVLCGSDRSRQMRSSELPLPTGDPRAEIRLRGGTGRGRAGAGAHHLQPVRGRRAWETLRGTDTLLIAGMLANMTVWQAAREAADRDFGVVVVMDCCASETLAWHGVLRTGVVGGLIRQRSSRDVIEMLEGLRT